MNFSLALLLALLCALGPVATAADGPAKADEVRVYKKIGDRELKLFIAKPADWKASDQRPALVFFFGGGWKNGASLAFASPAPAGTRGHQVAARTSNATANSSLVVNEQ